MSDFTSSWEEYRLLVINELEALNLKVDVAETKLQELLLELALIRQNSDKVEALIERVSDVAYEISHLKEGVESLEEKLKGHEQAHVDASTKDVVKRSRLKDRHWSLFLAVVAAIFAIVSALIK